MIPKTWRWKRCRQRQKYIPGIQTKRPDHGPNRRHSWKLTLQAVLKVAKPYFTSATTRRESAFITGFLVFLMVVENILGVLYTILVGRYMTALQKRDEEGFYTGLQNLAVFMIAMLCSSFVHGYTRAILQLRWSAALTRHLAHLYLNCEGCGAFYQLTLTGDIDNPDQRIIDEANDFVDTVLSLVSHMISNTLKIISFGGLLCKISSSAFTGTLAYVLFGTIIVVQAFGARLIGVQQLEAIQRATLRYNLIRVHENAESIAFFKGGSSEWARFENFYNALLSTMYESVVLHQCLGTLLKSFGYATFAVGPLLAGPAYFRGETEFGTLTQTSIAFNAIRDGFSFFMHRLPGLSSLATHAERLNALENALDLEAARVGTTLVRVDPGRAYIAVEEHHDAERPVLQLEGFTLRTPERRGSTQMTLLEDLSLQVNKGMSILVVGASGVGKSSLLRGIAGLWTDGRGFVRRCGGGSVFFMPQKPYMFFGTFREQLLYPVREDCTVSDEALQNVLHEVQLGHLIQRYSLEHVEMWPNVLSLGEQQRINFVRLLVRQNLQLALIDEGTSACDITNEEHLYRLLSQRLGSYISVGHRPTLRRYHTHVLRLQRRDPVSGSKEGAGCCQTVCSLLTMQEYESMAELQQQ